MNPRIVAVKAKEDFTLELVFENGEAGIFNMKPYLNIGVFRQLKKIELFKQVKPFLGSISWKTGQDLDPDTLYLDSKRNKFKKYPHSNKTRIAAEPKAKYGKK